MAEKRRAKPTRNKNSSNNPSEKEPRHRYKTRYNRAKIQKIQEAIMAVVESDSNDSDEESYTSANMESPSGNDQE